MTVQDAAKAAEILNPGKVPDRAEQAALDHLGERRWILWHADDYAAGVVRVLSAAGLLRDRVQEAEATEGHAVLRRLSDRERVLNIRRTYLLDQLVSDAAEQLQGGDDPADVAAFLLAKRAEINNTVDEANRAPLVDAAEQAAQIEDRS